MGMTAGDPESPVPQSNVKSAFAQLFRDKITEFDENADKNDKHTKLIQELQHYAQELDSWVQNWHDQRLWSVNLAPELVEHDEAHAQSVERLAKEIVAPYWKPEEHSDSVFTPRELVWLSVAAWLHDWGHCGGILEADANSHMHWISHSIEVRRLHGLLSQSWLKVYWKSIHGIERDDIAIPAGVLCGHHQGWTSSGNRPPTCTEKKNDYKSRDSVAWSPTKVKYEDLMAKYAFTPKSLSEDWLNHVRRVDGDGDYARFRKLLEILRVADAADLGQHRTPRTDKARTAQLRTCIIRELLSKPGTVSKSSRAENSASQIRLLCNAICTSGDDNLNDTIESWQKAFESTKAKLPEEIDAYLDFIKDQEQHMDVHRRIERAGVRFSQGKSGGKLEVHVKPSKAGNTGHQKIKKTIRRFLSREFQLFDPEGTQLKDYFPVSNNSAEFDNDPYDLDIMVWVNEGDELDETMQTRQQSGQASSQSNKQPQSLQKSDTAVALRDQGENLVSSWWESEECRLLVLGCVARELEKRNTDSLLTTHVGDLIHKACESDGVNSEAVDIDLRWNVRPWPSNKGTKQRLGEFLHRLHPDIEDNHSSLSIKWSGYRSWLDNARGKDDSFDDSAEKWWYSEEGKRVILGCVAEVLQQSGKMSAATSRLGAPIRQAVVDAGKSREWIDATCPYSGKGKRLGEFLRQLDESIVERRAKASQGDNATLPGHPYIVWRSYGDLVLSESDKEAQGWWYSEDATTRVPRWVAKAISNVGKEDEIDMKKLGWLLRDEVERLDEGTNFEARWKMRPWGSEPTRRVQMGDYLESYEVGIEWDSANDAVRWPNYLEHLSNV